MWAEHNISHWEAWQNGLNELIEIPQLHSVKLGEGAFRMATIFEVSNIPSIRSIDIGSSCFSGYYDRKERKWVGGASSFSLIGINEWMKWEIDLPLLQSVKLGGGAFRVATSFAMSNLTSLQSIEFGQWCFGGDFYNRGGISSFSLIGIIEWMKWEIDLPLLQSVRLGEDAFGGGSNRKTIDEYPYNYNNAMIMKSYSNW